MPSPTSISSPASSIKQSTNDSIRKRKEREIETINAQIDQLLELQKGDMELMRTAAETLKKCTSEWCIDTLKKEAEYWQGRIKERDEQIEALEQQRATIISGL